MYGNILKNTFKQNCKLLKRTEFLKERIITSQGAEITISTGETVLNFCAII
jgi:glycine C-acetyltransferase